MYQFQTRELGRRDFPSRFIGERPEVSLRRKPDKRRLPVMTIMIGFACKDSFIMASDSQMSSETSFQRWDEPKIFPVQFKGGESAMIGVAGSMDGANYFREFFERMAAGVAIETVEGRMIADTAEKALKETRRRILDQIDDGVTTSEQKQEHLLGFNFEVMIAYLCGGKYHLFTSELRHCLMLESRRLFETTGSGKEIASFVLTGCELDQCNYSEALGLAVYAVDRCRKFDSFCGGPTQHMIINEGQNGVPFSFSSWILEIYDRAAGNLDKSTPLAIKAAISAEVQKEERRFGEEYEKTKGVTARYLRSLSK